MEDFFFFGSNEFPLLNQEREDARGVPIARIDAA
jgi:hypothetical protein